MLFKLSLRNLRRSIKDYTIYFATLILGVAIFYIFNALGSQAILLKVSESTFDIIELMNDSLSVVSIFVSFVLGFLIVYASNFMMKRRKKEFGIYLLLGMEKAKITAIIVMETLCIGLISLIAGLVLGIAGSQGMSVVVANMFEADMTKYRFIISGEAVGKTLLYFACIYLIVLVFNTMLVGKARLISLLTAAKKQEKNLVKNPVVCIMVFVLGSVLLGTAYYCVTAGADDISQTSDFVKQIIKGIVGTFLVFWSVSGIMIFFASKNKRFYYKKLRCFTIKELAGRINTTVISGSIICLMLFITICILSSALSVKKSIDENLSSKVSIDVEFHRYFMEEDHLTESISDSLEKSGVDLSIFKDEEEILIYKILESDGKSLCMQDVVGKKNLDSLNLDEEYIRFLEELDMEIITLSDYNRAAKLYGNCLYELKDDEYMVIANFDSYVELYNIGLAEGRTITIGDNIFHPAYKQCKDGYLEMSSSNSNMGIIVVPDCVDLEQFECMGCIYLANYNASTDEERKKIEEYIDREDFIGEINIGNEDRADWINVNPKTRIYNNSIGLTALMIFIGVYLGIVMMISSAAILALKELSQAADNKEKYQTLRKLGVEEKQINHSLFAQSSLFFGLPLLLACIHSVFGIQTCMMILETFGRGGILYSVIITAMIFVFVYGIYFMLTYQCSKRIIKE